MTKESNKSIYKTVNWKDLIEPKDEELSDEKVSQILGIYDEIISKELIDSYKSPEEINNERFLEHLAQPTTNDGETMEREYNELVMNITKKEGHATHDIKAEAFPQIEQKAPVLNKNEVATLNSIVSKSDTSKTLQNNSTKESQEPFVNKEISLDDSSHYHDSGKHYLEIEFDELESTELQIIADIQDQAHIKSPSKEDKAIKPKRKFEDTLSSANKSEGSIASAVIKRRSEQRNRPLPGKAF